MRPNRLLGTLLLALLLEGLGLIGCSQGQHQDSGPDPVGSFRIFRSPTADLSPTKTRELREPVKPYTPQSQLSWIHRVLTDTGPIWTFLVGDFMCLVSS